MEDRRFGFKDSELYAMHEMQGARQVLSVTEDVNAKFKQPCTRAATDFASLRNRS